MWLSAGRIFQQRKQHTKRPRDRIVPVRSKRSKLACVPAAERGRRRVAEDEVSEVEHADHVGICRPL